LTGRRFFLLKAQLSSPWGVHASSLPLGFFKLLSFSLLLFSPPPEKKFMFCFFNHLFFFFFRMAFFPTLLSPNACSFPPVFRVWTFALSPVRLDVFLLWSGFCRFPSPRIFSIFFLFLHFCLVFFFRLLFWLGRRTAVPIFTPKSLLRPAVPFCYHRAPSFLLSHFFSFRPPTLIRPSYFSRHLQICSVFFCHAPFLRFPPRWKQGPTRPQKVIFLRMARPFFPQV